MKLILQGFIACTRRRSPAWPDLGKGSDAGDAGDHLHPWAPHMCVCRRGSFYSYLLSPKVSPASPAFLGLAWSGLPEMGAGDGFGDQLHLLHLLHLLHPEGRVAQVLHMLPIWGMVLQELNEGGGWVGFIRTLVGELE